jgi:hypothetical protein
MVLSPGTGTVVAGTSFGASAAAVSKIPSQSPELGGTFEVEIYLLS